MEAARGILVVLATAFIASECFIPSFKRDDIPEEPPSRFGPSCLSDIEVCSASVRHSPLYPSVAQDPRTLATHIDEICQLFHEYADCVRPAVGVCTFIVRNDVEAALSVGDFVCSNRGRSLLTDIQDSPCYTDQETLQDVGSTISHCVPEGVPTSDEPRSFCQEQVHVQQCAIPVITEQCGDAAAEFATEVLQRFASRDQYGCSNDSPLSDHLHCTRNNTISSPVSSYRSHKENLSTMHGLRSAVLRDMQHTPCYTEQETTLQAIQLSAGTCLREASPSEQRRMCQDLIHIERCATQATTQHCGEAAGEYVSEVLHRVTTVYQSACSNDRPQESLKRSLLGFFR